MRSLFLACVLTLAACTNLTFNTGDETPDRIAITPDSVAMERNGHADLAATYVFGAIAFKATDVTWTSSATNVATVTAHGDTANVDAVAPGTTTITVAGSGLTATVEITINTPHAVHLVVDPPQPTMPAGRDVTLSATATMSDATSMVVTNQATWTSTNTSVATVSLGAVHGVAIGDSNITATFDGAFSTTRVAVTAAVVTSIVVTPANQLLSKGQTQQYTAMGTFSNGTMSNITTSVTWASTVTSVATISNTTPNKGLASTPGAGTTMITATSGSGATAVVGSTGLMVANAALQSVAITPVGTTVNKSADVPYTAIATFTDASTLDVTASATWSSTNMNTATISNTSGSNGIADALALGTTTIGVSVTLGTTTKTDSTPLTVILSTVNVASYGAETGFVGKPCAYDAIKVSLNNTTVMPNVESVYVCTVPVAAVGGGIVRGDVGVGTAVAWAGFNTVTSPSGALMNFDGVAMSTHRNGNTTSMTYVAKPSGALGNWFRNATATPMLTSALLTDTQSTPAPLSCNSARFGYTGFANEVGCWDPTTTGTGQSQILTGATAGTKTNLSGATGLVMSLGGNNTPSNGVFAVVLGEDPNGNAKAGGVYFATTPSNWATRNTGITGTSGSGGDIDNLMSFADLDYVTNATTGSAAVKLVGVRKGARIYRSADNGANWAASGTGIPAKAIVTALYAPPGQTFTFAPDVGTVYAATNIGLYKSTDQGETWALDDFQGRAIRGIGLSQKSGVLFVAIDDSETGDSPLYHHN